MEELLLPPHTTRKLIPLDPRVLANVVAHYEGETLQVPECDDPVYHGQGIITFRSGFVYTGTFAYGRMHGKGRIEWSNGVVYEGDFSENEISGHGTYTWPNGSSYVGGVLRAKRHGQGVYICGNLGVPCLPTTESIDVNEMDDQEAAHLSEPLLFAYHEEDPGNNVMAQSNARYEGEWADGLPHGKGVLVYDDAHNVRYEGDFVRGQRHGKGQMRYANGNLFVGEWVADVKCGHGVMMWMSNNNLTNIHNHLEKTEAEEEGEAAEIYDGEWHGDIQQGFGRHVWGLNRTQRTKNWYEGEFQNGLRHGSGVFYYANGARYEGEWHENVKDGRGLFFYEDGHVFMGRFQQDRCGEPSIVGGGQSTTDGNSSSSSAANTISNSSTRLLLYVDDLLPQEKDLHAKARKSIGNAALRLNSELRELYRQYTKEGNNRSTTNESVTLMEQFECRKLLADSGLHFNNSQLLTFVQQIRTAQRQSVLDAARQHSDGIVEFVHFFVNELPSKLDHYANLPHIPFNSTRLGVVPFDQLLLFREFVELLVRISFWKKIRTGATRDSISLAESFTELYEQMARQRLECAGHLQHQPSNSLSSSSWITHLHAQLYGKDLQCVYKKRHNILSRLFCECLTSSGGICQKGVEDEDEELPQEKDVVTVSIRALLAMLRREVPTFFSSDFRVRDALDALEFTIAAPIEDKEDGSRMDERQVDPFILDMELVYSEFLDTLATVLYAQRLKQRHESSPSLPSDDLPLYVLLDQFVECTKATHLTAQTGQS